MKSWKLLACLSVTLLCGSLRAQNVVNANIPFNFELGRTTLPAGEYRIEEVNHILRWHCFKAHTGAFVMTMPTSGGERRSTGLLRFNRYGETYFFAGVEMPYNGDGAVVPKTRREKELAQRITTGESTGVAFSMPRK